MFYMFNGNVVSVTSDTGKKTQQNTLQPIWEIKAHGETV